MSEQQDLVYLPLGELHLWGANPKLHATALLCESIRMHGFRDPIKVDTTLGVVVFGNGRVEALRMLQMGGEGVPEGIVLREDGEWLVPVQVGLDAHSVEEAIAFALDHNNLVMAGAAPKLVARLWQQDAYLSLLLDLAAVKALPVSVTEDELARLVDRLRLPEGGVESLGEDAAVSAGRETAWWQCGQCGFEWRA